MIDDLATMADGRCLIEGRRIELTSFDQLCRATPTSDSEIIQVEAGAMRGSLHHATMDDLSLGIGTFSRGLISQGVYSQDRVTIGMLFSHSPEAGAPEIASDIAVWGPGAEHQRRYYGGGSFGGIYGAGDGTVLRCVERFRLSRRLGSNLFVKNDVGRWPSDRARTVQHRDADQGPPPGIAVRSRFLERLDH